MPTERMIDAAANYIASATRCKETLDASTRRNAEGGGLTERDLVEIHGARLGLIWATHQTDLPSALNVMRAVEAGRDTSCAGHDQLQNQARHVLESRLH